MQKKLIIGIVIISIAGLFVGNWVYGNILSRKIEKRLEAKVELITDNVQIKFEEIDVNPLFSELRLRGMYVVNQNGVEVASAQKVELDMPYHEAVRLLKSRNIKELKAFKVYLINSRFLVSEVNDYIEIDELSLSFRGHLTQEDIKHLNEKFPQEKQRLKIEAEGLSLAHTPWMDALGFTPDQIKRFNHVDEFKMVARFKPEEKKLQIEELKVLAPILTYQLEADMDYTGDGMDALQIEQAKSSMELQLGEGGIEWGDPEESGRFALQNLYLKMDGEANYKNNKGQLTRHTTNFLLEGLTLKYAGKKKKQLESRTALLGLKMDQLSVDRMVLNSSLDKKRMTISDSEITSSLIDASFSGKLLLDEENLTPSTIEKGNVTIHYLVPGVLNALSTFELMTGQSLPRDGKKIVLELSGDVSRPNIKGFKY